MYTCSHTGAIPLGPKTLSDKTGICTGLHQKCLKMSDNVRPLFYAYVNYCIAQFYEK